jgi:hypothetical protein
MLQGSARTWVQSWTSIELKKWQKICTTRRSANKSLELQRPVASDHWDCARCLWGEDIGPCDGIQYYLIFERTRINSTSDWWISWYCVSELTFRRVSQPCLCRHVRDTSTDLYIPSLDYFHLRLSTWTWLSWCTPNAALTNAGETQWSGKYLFIDYF